MTQLFDTEISVLISRLRSFRRRYSPRISTVLLACSLEYRTLLLLPSRINDEFGFRRRSYTSNTCCSWRGRRLTKERRRRRRWKSGGGDNTTERFAPLCCSCCQLNWTPPLLLLLLMLFLFLFDDNDCRLETLDRIVDQRLYRRHER